jgi:RNase adaptor protein for sRNA GlmZ degradation
MTQRKNTPFYTTEFRARGVRLFNEQRSEYRNDIAACQAIASQLEVLVDYTIDRAANETKDATTHMRGCTLPQLS